MGASDSTVRRAKPQRPASHPKSSSSMITLFNFFGRLIAWYALYTVIFRCPSHPTEKDLAVCRTSHSIKHAIKPHVEPYYDEYLAPYVDQYSPYVHHANKEYIVPAYNTAYVTYRAYGEPYVLQSRKHAESCGQFLMPHVETAKEKGQVYFKAYLEPHVQTANEIWLNMKPKVDHAQTQAETYWTENVIPAYVKVSPYLNKAYEQGKYIVVVVVAPIVKDGGEKALGWGRGLWSEVVRPQVGRIGERLGGSNGNTVPLADVSSSVVSAMIPDASESVISSMISSVSAQASASASKASKEPATRPKLSREEERNIIDSDLETWTSKFESSAGKAIADLKIVIDEMADKAISSKKNSATKDVSQLENVVNEGFANLKKEVVSIVASLSKDSTDEEKSKAQDRLFAATRKVGTNIRDSAQSIRQDSEKYLSQVYDSVSESADQHLDVLDGIHNMGMQELGMKWAWMDFVTYNDWKKYHDLKKGMKEARIRIIKSAEKNVKLDEFTKWVESNMEGRATDVAKEAAEELLRIKKIGKKKIQLLDASDNFTDDHIPVPAKKTAQQVMESAEEMKDAVVGEKQIQEGGFGQQVISVADDAQEKLAEQVAIGQSTLAAAMEAGEHLASKASEKGNDPAEKATESASSIVSEVTEAAKAHVPGGVNAGFIANAEPMLFDDDNIIDDDTTDGLASRLSVASKAVSEAVHSAISSQGYTTEPPAHENLKSYASELSESAVSAASSILYGTPTPAAEQMVSIATDKYSAAIAAASTILYGRPTPTHQLLLSKAEAAYASVTSAAEDKYRSAKRLAVTKVNDEDKPIKESMYSAAKEQYNSAISAADASYTSFVEAAGMAYMSLDEAVASADMMWNDALEAASTKVYGTPQPASESLASVASEKYSSAKAEAQKVYDSWYASASSGIYGTSTPIFQSATEIVAEKFSSGVSSASSVASEASSSASSIASEAGSSASSFVSDASSVASSVAVSATSAAAEGVGEAASAASEFLFGAPAPTGLSVSAAAVADDAAEAIQQRYEDLQNLVNELVHGKEPSFTESVMSRYNSAVYGEPTPAWQSAASAAQTAVSSIVDEASAQISSYYAQASAAVYGPEKSSAEKAIEQIRAARDQAIESVSIAVYGTPKGTFAEATDSAASLASQVTDSAASFASQATDSAASFVSQATDSAASLASQATDSAVSLASDAASSASSLAVAATDAAKQYMPSASSYPYERLVFINARKKIMAASSDAELWLQAAQAKAAQAAEDVKAGLENAGERAAQAAEDVKEAAENLAELIKDEL
ncbi:hypothetical protein EDC01DRAFT_297775 [Geopyxis carbonaria]|nr:hypothetical protein EDC01DRAFT_297775 [Geopyxis carbonaria]